MASVYETMVTSLIKNAVMQKVYVDGAHRVYTITPAEGYVLHDSVRDWTENPGTLEETFKQGFTRATASCAANYDFTANPREFYAVLRDSVPADQIFGN